MSWQRRHLKIQVLSIYKLVPASISHCFVASCREVESLPNGKMAPKPQASLNRPACTYIPVPAIIDTNGLSTEVIDTALK